MNSELPLLGLMMDETKCPVCKTGDIKEEWGMCPTCKAEETLSKYYKLKLAVRDITKQMWEALA
jgi:RNA polymerase subunit RPABC4/transcription elongation factor Spt4